MSTYLINKSCLDQRILTCALVGLAWLSSHIVKLLSLNTTQTRLANKKSHHKQSVLNPIGSSIYKERLLWGRFYVVCLNHNKYQNLLLMIRHVAYTRLMILQRWFIMENPFHFIEGNKKRSYAEFKVWPMCQYLDFPLSSNMANKSGSPCEKFKHERLKNIPAIEHRLHRFNNNKELAEFSIIHHIKEN